MSRLDGVYPAGETRGEGSRALNSVKRGGGRGEAERQAEAK